LKEDLMDHQLERMGGMSKMTGHLMEEIVGDRKACSK